MQQYAPDNIPPPELVKLSAKVIDSHLCNTINKGLQNSFLLHQTDQFTIKSVEIL